jgi:LDH2 family malate/lactate/ureidoglycolate dehydrogenase
MAQTLLDAEVEDHSSHGLSRLPLYLSRLRSGLVDPRPKIEVVAGTGAAVLLDGGNGLGPVVGTRAMELATTLSDEYGVGLCSVRHSNHLGSLSYFVKLAAAKGHLGICLSNGPPAVAPPGGTTPLLGTNPIAAGIPTADEAVVVDMATTQVARGRVAAAAAASETIPIGWGVDENGRDTTDPGAVLRGSLSSMGGAKGFALALLVESLTGVLAAAGVGPDVSGTAVASDRPSNVGHLMLAIKPEGLAPGFRERMSLLARTIRSTPPACSAKPVRMPGDTRRTHRQRRVAAGISLPEHLVRELNEMATEWGLRPL